MTVESFPIPSDNNYKTTTTTFPFGAPSSDPNNPVIDAWHCRVAPATHAAAAYLDAAYVFCCPPR
jgi:hypothetical protein